MSDLNNTVSSVHECDLPSLSSLSSISEVEDYNTSLSFCLPTSLAFAKRLTWEQTPWIPASFDDDTKPVNPISTADAHEIAQYLSSHAEKEVSVEAIQGALLFGSTYPASPSSSDSSSQLRPEDLGAYPTLYLIFPSSQHPPSTNPVFLRTWRDEIVKPAFEKAWRDSGLISTHASHLYPSLRMLPPNGFSTEENAYPASGFLQHLKQSGQAPVRNYWPSWTDSTYKGGESEGKYTDLRAEIYHQAWLSIQGMLENHPDLTEYQNPILLAVARGTVHVNERLNAKDRFRAAAQEWDGFVDARFIEKGSWKVRFEVLAGVKRKRVERLAIEDGEKKEKEGDSVEKEVRSRGKKVKVEEMCWGA